MSVSVPSSLPAFRAVMRVAWLLGVLLPASAWAAGADAAGKVGFNKDVRPILADACFKCHGADEKQRKGKLRLDVREAALEKKAIVPGKPDESELIKRILTTDEEDLMPPPKENHKLSDAEKATLRRWIEQGAVYERHWSFMPVTKPPVPQRADVTNPVDAFVRATLEERHLSPAKPATKEQWLRRVYFALTGLPPSLKEIDEFLANDSPETRAKLVDRLLTSDAGAEHLAKDWLDAARYADSYGRHEDGDMLVWPWRDWVIHAFRNNMPYDRFILEQTAGDMLPEAKREQFIATVFNRMALQSNESGNDPEEFRLDQVSDRVRANGMAFLGLSLECAKCHDHKYDPVSQKEYWQMAAIFDNIDENGVYSQFCPQAVPSPSMLLPDAEQERKLKLINGEIAKLEEELKAVYEDSRPAFNAYIASNRLPGELEEGGWNRVRSWLGGGKKVEWNDGAKLHLDFEKKSQKDKEMINQADADKPARVRHKLETIDKGPVGGAMKFMGDDELTIAKMADFKEWDWFSFAVWLKPEEKRERAVVIASSRGGVDDGRGFEVLMENEVVSFALMHFVPGNEIRIRAKKPLPLGEWTHLAFTYDGSSHASGLKMYWNGELLETEVVHDNLIKDIARRKEWGDIDLDQIRFTLGGREHDSPLKNCGVDEYWVFGRVITPSEVKLLAQQKPSRDDWYEWFVQRSEAARAIRKELVTLRQERTEVTNDVLEMMVMKDLPQQRPCFVHPRGNPKQRGDAVEPGTPESIMPFPKDAPRNRLGFARWLVSRDNPLTARVAVNRFWQILFGRGIVGTPQDFGTRGDLPTHPELLEWLAADFMEHGWDVRRILRLVALSETFAQSTVPADPETLKTDPDNHWLARGPFTRLRAEELRDQSLAVSGLLCRKTGGPSVKPYMPFGLYHDSGLQQKYDQGHGDDLYRRSLYSFWRRTLPPPELAAFDAPSREFCVVKREKTNTPLQALVLLNSEGYVETQRVLGEQLAKEFPQDDAARCAKGFRMLTGRLATGPEIEAMKKVIETQRANFKANAAATAELMRNGEHAPDTSVPAVETAATAMLLRTLMSHVEALYR